MTVNSTVNRVEYAGDGVSTAFTVGFYFLAAEDLKVILRDASGGETLQTNPTHYTVADAANPAGGSITMATAPAVGEKLVIVRDPALTQLTDYQANDAFPAETHERALDKLTMQIQRLAERTDRSASLEETATSGDGTYDFGGNSISNLGETCNTSTSRISLRWSGTACSARPRRRGIGMHSPSGLHHRSRRCARSIGWIPI